MNADKSTADVPVELRSLVCSRELLIGFVERESLPESEKAAAAANYGREIAAVNAAKANPFNPSGNKFIKVG